MPTAHHATTVHAPLAAVYQLWLDFEAFPKFASPVRAVTTTADFFSTWTLSLGQRDYDVDVEIDEQLPERLVRWHSLTGDAPHRGVIVFTEDAAGETELDLSVEWEPVTAAGRAAALVGLDDRAVRTLLTEFARYAESAEAPSGHSYVKLASVDPPATA